MTVYATTEDVQNGFRTLTTSEEAVCTSLLEEAAVMLNSFAPCASHDVKKVVSCRMVRRALATASTQNVVMGSTQGTVTAGPYSQSWTFGSGSSAGDLYLTAQEKRMLGIGNKIGSRSPLEGM